MLRFLLFFNTIEHLENQILEPCDHDISSI